MNLFCYRVWEDILCLSKGNFFSDIIEFFLHVPHISGIGPTLRDGQLDEQCRDIRTRYMQKAENFVTQSMQSWIQAKQTLTELQGKNSMHKVDPLLTELCPNIH